MRHPLDGVTVVSLKQAVTSPPARSRHWRWLRPPARQDGATATCPSTTGCSPLFDHQGMVVSAARDQDAIVTGVRDLRGRKTATRTLRGDEYLSFRSTITPKT